MTPILPFTDSSLELSMFVEVLTNTWAGIVVLFLATIFAGLLAGKERSDAAKAGKVDSIEVNDSIGDWLADAGYGFVGGILGLAIMQLAPSAIPVIALPAFGYAGRKVLYNFGMKAEQITNAPK